MEDEIVYASLPEFHGVIAWSGTLSLPEAKASLRPRYFLAFSEFVERGEIFDYFPEFAADG
jgi:hypothetical protein